VIGGVVALVATQLATALVVYATWRHAEALEKHAAEERARLDDVVARLAVIEARPIVAWRTPGSPTTRLVPRSTD
jgi:hypothetical protein